MEKIKAEKLKEKIENNEDFILLDVLTKDSYKARHLPGAINIPYTDSFVRETKDKLPDKEKEIVAYCAGYDCKASDHAADKLEKLGYENVKLYQGGLEEWEEMGYEMEGEKVKT